MYGRPDATFFNGSWVSLMYDVPVYDTHFNWAKMIVEALRSNIYAALAPDEGYASEFYMAYYLLDAVCARCHFEGWSHNWVLEHGGPIHKDLMVLWDSRYKQEMDSIAGSFIPTLYVKLFGKYPPCMSERAMETITQVAY